MFHVHVLQQHFLETERELRREIEDLKEKIYMCSEEYKTLYIEKSKLQRKLLKAAGRSMYDIEFRLKK